MTVQLEPQKDTGRRAPQKSSKGTSEFLFFIAINVLVLPFSAYQTYEGYQVEFQWITAGVVALISAVLFAAMNFEIRKRRLEGKKHFWQTLMYIVPLGFSFAGNFTAFYTNQMQNQLYDYQIAADFDTLNTTYSNAKKILVESAGVDAFESAISAKLAGLKKQFDGDSDAGIPPSWGDSCRFQWGQIKTFLKSEDPSGTGLINALQNKTYIGAKSLVDPCVARIINEKSAPIDPLIREFDTLYNRIDVKVKAAKLAGTLTADGRILLDEIAMSNNTIGKDTQTKMGDDFSYTTLKPSATNQMFSIKYAFENGFVDMPSKSATFFSLFLSLIVDLAALLYILFFVKLGKPSRGRILRGPDVIN